MAEISLNRGDQMAVTCPNCGIATRLIVKVNSHTDEKFLGCPNYPRCRHTQAIPVQVWMEASGQPRLIET